MSNWVNCVADNIFSDLKQELEEPGEYVKNWQMSEIPALNGEYRR